ncbi:MAG: hypothetical protein S4CHLAM7_10730 [Chlamydiae bacterium]|nr:hypothetical protein [Chlamydiota bacterium]
MAKEQAPKKKVKRPTAEKRMIQNKKVQGQNRVVKSKIRTATRSFSASLKENKNDDLVSDLKNVYSLVDKAVKAKLYKPNKANRIKSHYAKNLKRALATS